MSIRNKLRQATLGKKGKSLTYELDLDGEKIELEVREMSFGAKLKLHSQEWDGEQPKDAPQDDAQKEYEISDEDRVLLMVVASCYVPGTEELVFERSDVELMRNAYGSWVQDLTLLMYEANGIDINTKSDTDKEPAEAPKN